MTLKWPYHFKNNREIPRKNAGLASHIGDFVPASYCPAGTMPEGGIQAVSGGGEDHFRLLPCTTLPSTNKPITIRFFPSSFIMLLRKAQLSDAPALWALRIDAIRSQCAAHYPADLLQIWTAGSVSAGFSAQVADHFYLIESGGVIVASGMMNVADGQIDAIFVTPGHFRKGYGAQIMDFLENLARTAAVPELHLKATLNAAAFYRSRGFVGDAVAQYHSPRGIVLDCVPMSKRLT